MRKSLFAYTAILAVTAFSNSASAEEFPKWYLGLSAGAAYQTDSEYSGATRGKFDHKIGHSASAALGYKPANMPNARLELEISRHSQKVELAGGTSGGGESRATALMANAFYDFSDSGIIPYVGAGIGGAKFDLTSPNPTGNRGDSTDLAYQVMAGLAFQFEGMPRADWTLGYKYFAPFSDPELEGFGGNEYEYDNHSVEVGGRFHF